MSPCAIRRLITIPADLTVSVGSLVLANLWRNDHWPIEHEVALMLGVIPCTLVFFHIVDAYEVLERLSVRTWVERACLGQALVLCLFLLVAFLLKDTENFSRTVIIGWMTGSLLGMTLIRLALRQAARRRLAKGLGVELTALVGQPRQVLTIANLIDREKPEGLMISVLVADGLVTHADAQVPVFPLADLGSVVATRHIDRVLICARLDDQRLIETVMRILLHRPVLVQLVPDLSTIPIFNLRQSEIAGQPALNLSGSPLSDGQRLVKQLEDLILGSLILVIISLPMLLIALVVKLTSRGPVLFAQERHGLGGKVIRVYKFRSMYADTAADPVSTNARASDPVRPSVPEYEPGEADLGYETPGSGLAHVVGSHSGSRPGHGSSGMRRRQVSDITPDDFRQAQDNDPRITPFGRFLRRTSLDELPQFINVVRGDMSIVGPRPHAIRHNEQYRDSILDLMRRHYVKPGITGLAQIRGARGETRTVRDMRRRVHFDLDYIRRWSLLLDLWIIWRTLWVGFFNRQP